MSERKPIRLNITMTYEDVVDSKQTKEYRGEEIQTTIKNFIDRIDSDVLDWNDFEIHITVKNEDYQKK